MLSLDEVQLTQLKGVGEKLAAVLHKLDIHSLQDLLFHLPFRYEDRTRFLALNQFRVGQHGLFEASIVKHSVVFGRRRSLEVIVQDASSTQVTLRFFHFSAAQTRQLDPGRVLRAFGEARLGRNGVEFYHPEYQVLSGDERHEIPDMLTPIYPLTEGIQQPRLRSLCKQALSWLDRCDIQDLLPDFVRTEYQLPALKHALKYLHAPPTDADQSALFEGRHPCQQRLIVEELLAHHLSLLKLRSKQRAHPAKPCSPTPDTRTLEARFLNALPFTLTDAQQRVANEIKQDLSCPLPMLRLVQGDVGSGKTVVAALAAIQTIAAGGQVALMAPTEILAEQHLSNFKAWLEPLGITIAWLSGKSKGKQRAETLALILDGRAQITVGTHALFQDDVVFQALTLAIIDEQHRFGVHQRLALKNKGAGLVPHQLVMTATPIPRTLAMSAYADLDTSVIDELPPGRQEIETFVLPDTRRLEMVEKVQKSCAAGNQAYWVCTLIEESESLQCQAAEDAAAWLTSQLPTLVVGLVHGRMKAKEKSFIMAQFKAGKIDLLVATTVIEVGVDVPDATLIIIENPERLGLAQLHQLRGRVGRGSKKSYCALMYHAPLSQHGKERLKVMKESNDGFIIAEKDLEIRGPGEVLGTRQTGLVEFKIADLLRDKGWLPQIKAIAAKLEPDSLIEERLIGRWLGERSHYAEV